MNQIKMWKYLAFRSNLLVHGNLPCSGVRHSLVFFMHNNLFPETFVHVENNNQKRKSNINQKNKNKKK